MARDPLTLQETLSTIEGVQDVYIVAPTNVKLATPYIMLDLDADYVLRADNAVYASFNRFTVTLITRDPLDPLFEVLRALPLSSFDRRFVAAGLTHFVFQLYY